MHRWSIGVEIHSNINYCSRDSVPQCMCLLLCNNSERCNRLIHTTWTQQVWIWSQAWHKSTEPPTNQPSAQRIWEDSQSHRQCIFTWATSRKMFYNHNWSTIQCLQSICSARPPSDSFISQILRKSGQIPIIVSCLTCQEFLGIVLGELGV